MSLVTPGPVGPPSVVSSPTRSSGVQFARDLARFGDQVAVIDGDHATTYCELAELVDRAREQLGKTRRLVALECDNSIGSLAYYLACLASSHPVILTNATSASTLAERYQPDIWIRRSDGSSQIGFSSSVGVLDSVDVFTARSITDHSLNPDLALLMSTSGSCGSPKLVRLSARNLEANAEAIDDYLAIRPSDVAALVLPMSYSYGLSVINSHLRVGATIWLSGKSVVDPCFWREFREHGATSIAGVPYTFEQLEKVGFSDFDLPSLRYVTQAGGRMPADRVRAFAQLGQRRGWDLFVMYGQTEATARMAYLPPDCALTAPSSIGRAIPGGSFSIDDNELVYRGDNVMMGYANSPSDLARGAEVSALRTGDLARYDSSGMIEVTGRIKRIAKVFGLRIDLDELERSASTPREPVTCIDLGDRVGVAVVSESHSDLTLVTRRVSHASGVPTSAIAAAQLPGLPRTVSGKPDYEALRNALSSLEADVVSTAARRSNQTSRANQTNELVEIYTRLLNVPADSVSESSTFVSLHGDSLSYVATGCAVEDLLGCLPTNWHLLTIKELSAQGTVATRKHWLGLRRLETSVLLRALAVVAVVASHIGVFNIRGGAHVLLAIAGYTFARFHLNHRDSAHRDSGGATRHALLSFRRIIAPAMAWLLCLVIFTDDYRPQVLLHNSWLSSNADDPEWRYWFIEAIALILIAAIAAMAVPALRNAEKRAPYAFALTVLGVTTALSFAFAGDVKPHSIYSPTAVAWVFAAGWVLAKSRTRVQKLATLAACFAFSFGFFPDGGRVAVFSFALLALAVLAQVVIPSPLHGGLSWIAAGSLFIYLMHFQVYPLFGENLLLALIASIVIGGVTWQLYQRFLSLVGPALASRALAARDGRANAAAWIRGSYPNRLRLVGADRLQAHLPSSRR